MNLYAKDLADRLDFVKSCRGWRGRCPACSYPNVAILSTKGNLRCVSCGDDVALRAELARIGSGGAPKWDDTAGPTSNLSRREKVARAMAIWNGADPAGGTPADVYLTSRALPGLAASAALRWRMDVPHPSPAVPVRIPAMVAVITDVSNEPTAVHRTYLTPSGRKSDVDPQKCSKGPLWHGAIRLDPVAPELVIGEGIESSASAGLILGLPAWAAISAGNLAAGLVLPDEVRSVVIACDHDLPDAKGKCPGQIAAARAATRWRAEGRKVRIALPDTPGRDFNDVLVGRSNA